jgi:hypothetical protein
MSIDPITIALIAGGTALQGYAQNKAQKKQESLADQMALFQSKKAGEGRESIERFLKGVTPEARRAEAEGVRTELERGLGESVGTASAFEKPENFAGKISPEYAAVRATGQGRTDERLKRAMAQLSAINTPGQQALAESMRYGRSAGDVDAANAASQNVGRSYLQAIDQVRPDPFLTMVGQIMSGVGASGALSPLPAPDPSAASTALGLKAPTGPALGITAKAKGLGLKPTNATLAPGLSSLLNPGL